MNGVSNSYIIGDIHGCANTFRQLVTEKLKLKKSDTLYCVGDYIDRGPDSKGVIDFILELRKQGFLIQTVRGNHEQMLLESVHDAYAFDQWLQNGGVETLKSFKVNSAAELESGYLSFFRETVFYIKTADFIVVHAGLNFNIPDPFIDTDSMLWIRDEKYNQSVLGGKLLIHGHTPKMKNYILSQKMEGSVNLDGGCVFKEYRGYGHLFALDFTKHELIFTENID